MSAHDRLGELLPSLYRPMPEDETLLNRLLAAVGFTLDVAAEQLQHVLRAHWFDIADQALWDAHYQTARRQRGLPPANVRNAKDVKELLQYPHVADLSRLCALLNLPLWREPPALRETVEEYRDRIRDMLAAYRLGPTTLPALRRLVEAALPEDMAGSKAEQRWPFAIEEPAPLKTVRAQITLPDVQEGDMIGPLHFWEPGQAHGRPTVYIEGVAPNGVTAAATEQPTIERFTPAGSPVGIALAYNGTVPPGQTLRLSPARRSWLVVDGLLQASVPETSANVGSDPSLNGPWQPLIDLPTGRVHALAEAIDHTLWFIIEEAGDWRLHRYDGSQFTAVTHGAPAGPWRALLHHNATLYLATDRGLQRAAVFPAEGQSHALAPVAAVPEPVYALAVLPDGRLACAGNDGLALLNPDGSLHSRLLPGVALRAIFAREGRLYLATPQALLLHSQDSWFRYEGESVSENRADWLPIDPADIPAASSPLPAVHTLAATPDGSLWIGTARGLARYIATTTRDLAGYYESDLAFTTMLEAYPDLGTRPVHALHVDERGLLWITGDNGLLRYDGRDLAQRDFTENRWRPLGLATALYPDVITEIPRGHWRYDRAEDTWSRYEPQQHRHAPKILSERTQTSPALTAALLTPSLRADLGEFDGATFSQPQPVPLTQFRMRLKPDETRIVDGGLPALPAHIDGARWRYLQREPSPLAVPSGRPWWSREGRLFRPPDDQAHPPGHFRDEASLWQADGQYSKAVFAYTPSARLWMEYLLPPPIGVRVRLFKRAPDQSVDPALLERVWSLLVRAKAAGVPLQLAVEGTIEEGENL